MLEQNTATQQQVEAPDLTSTGLEGTGIDLPGLAENLKKEAEKNLSGSTPPIVEKSTLEKKEEKKEESTSAVESKEKGETTEEIVLTDDIAVGDEINAGDNPAEDGEYEMDDGTKVVIKEGKVDSLTPKELTKSTKPTIDNPFVSQESDDEPLAKVENFDQAAALLTSKTGIEIKSVQDIPRIAEKYTELQGSVEALTAEKNQLGEYKTVFENMPEEIFSIVYKYLNEEDYRQEIKNVARMNVDFSKPVSSYSDREIVELYNPDKFSEEDYQFMAEDKGMQAAISLARSKYSDDQAKFKSTRETYKKESEAVQKAFSDSVNTSLESFKKDVPYLQEKHQKKVESILKGGVYGIMDLFVNTDGMLKPEAAKLVGLAIYGEQAINTQQKKAANKAESGAREKILKRVSTKEERKAQNKGGAPQTVEQEQVQRFTKDVLPNEDSQSNPFLKPYYGEK